MVSEVAAVRAQGTGENRHIARFVTNFGKNDQLFLFFESVNIAYRYQQSLHTRRGGYSVS